MMQTINSELGNFDSIGIFISLIISVIALVISIISYKATTLKADLYLIHQVYGEEDYYEGIHHENGSAALVLNAGDTEGGWGGKLVTEARPGNEVEIVCENRGKVAAKNPIINFEFYNMGFCYELEKNNEWRGITHNHGIGTWAEIRWQPVDNTVIHPGIPISFKNFQFSGSEVCANAYIMVIISADNAKMKKFRIPVIIR